MTPLATHMLAYLALLIPLSLVLSAELEPELARVWKRALRLWLKLAVISLIFGALVVLAQYS